MNRVLRLFLELRDFLFAIDPGLTNLRTALRGTVGVVVSFIFLSALAVRWDQPPAIAFVGLLVAMLGAMIVNDDTRQKRLITSLGMVVPVALSVSGAILLQAWPIPRLLAFLGVTFLGVWSRRYGPRWQAFGFLAFMSFTVPLFASIPVEAVGAAVLSATLGCAIAGLLRFIVFPELPEPTLRAYLRAVELRSQNVLAVLAQELDRVASVSAPERPIARIQSYERVRRSVRSLNELIIAIEMFLKAGETRTLRSLREGLQMRLFDREMALRRILESCRQIAFDGVDTDELMKRAAILIRGTRSFLRRRGPRPVPDITPSFDRAVRDFLLEQEKPLLGASTVEAILHEKSELTRPAALAPAPAFGMHVNTRQAVQATIATSIASLLGMSISPDRWYWASVASFVIFTGASRGETMLRAFWRVIGTLAGLVAGLVLAWAQTGQTTLEWTTIVLAVFLGLYGARMAFGFWTAFSFTTMIALLFAVQGRLTTHLLVLRLEETALGAAVGALIGAFVVPLATRSMIRTGLAKILRTMSDILGDLPRDPMRGSSAKQLVRSLRAMDQDLMDLRTAAAPISGPITLVKRGETTSLLYDVAALAHFVRHLATSKPEEFPDMVTAKHRCHELSERMIRLARALESSPRTPPLAVSVPLAQHPLEDSFFTRIEEGLSALERRV